MWSLEVFSYDQVLPRENGVSSPWNFPFLKCSWRKRSSIKHEDSSLDFKSDRRKINFCGNEISDPAVEAISLDMKQQELDGRYKSWKKCIDLYTFCSHFPLHPLIGFVDASRLEISTRFMLLKREIVVLLTHYDLPCMKIRFLLFWVSMFRSSSFSALCFLFLFPSCSILDWCFWFNWF